MGTALEVEVLAPHCASSDTPAHWDVEGVLCYCKVKVQVQSALVIYWHQRNRGARYYLAERKVLTSYLDLSDITLIGVLGHPVTITSVWKSQLTLSLCWWGWGWSNSFFCVVWLEYGYWLKVFFLASLSPARKNGLLLGFCCCWVASFFRSESGIYEAKRKPSELTVMSFLRSQSP